VPTLVYQSIIHMIWGITARMEDWRTRPSESRSRWIKMVSIAATHPGDMLVLALAVWVVKRMHLRRRRRGGAS